MDEQTLRPILNKFLPDQIESNKWSEKLYHSTILLAFLTEVSGTIQTNIAFIFVLFAFSVRIHSWPSSRTL